MLRSALRASHGARSALPRVCALPSRFSTSTPAAPAVASANASVPAAGADGSLLLTPEQVAKVRAMSEEIDSLRRKTGALEALVSPRARRLETIASWKTMLIALGFGSALGLALKINDYDARSKLAEEAAAAARAEKAELVGEAHAALAAVTGVVEGFGTQGVAALTSAEAKEKIATGIRTREKLRLELVRIRSVDAAPHSVRAA